jgi:hypothetical protein
VPSQALPPSRSAQTSLDSAEGTDETQRKLIFLRYLVRHGVYNEGFANNGIPEQYHRSLGLDDSGDADL